MAKAIEKIPLKPPIIAVPKMFRKFLSPKSSPSVTAAQKLTPARSPPILIISLRWVILLTL